MAAVTPLTAGIPAVVRRMVQADGLCRSVLVGDACSAARELVATDALGLAGLSAPQQREWRLVYDVMRVQRDRVLFFAEHVQRVASSYASVAGHAMPAAVQTQIREALQSYISDPAVRLATRAGSTEEQNVKLVLWLAGDVADDKGCPFVLFFVKSFFPPASWYVDGTATLALLYDAVRDNPNAKVVQASLRARATALQNELGVFEVLLVHGEDDGYVMPEGSRSNYLLLTRDGRLLCSVAEDILPGITLSATVRAAERAGLGVVERRRLGLRELCAAESYIMLGTSVGPLPIGRMVLYHDEESKRHFERMAAYCKLDPHAIPGLRVVSTHPPRAELEFSAHNDTLTRLKTVYDAAALA